MVACNNAHEQRKYVTDSFEVNNRPEMRTQGKHAFELRSAKDVQDCYPRGVPTGPLENLVACEYSSFLTERMDHRMTAL